MKKGMKILTALSVAFMFTLSSYAAGKDLLKSNIPQIYGKAKGASEGSSDLTIIHIQDAHGNVEAQENIQSIIKTLAEQGKIDAISDEGRATLSNMEGFNGVSEEDAELVADFWTKYDLFNGALRYNALDDRKMTVFGNEDMSYYNQGLEAFKNSNSNKKESIAAAENIKGAMEALKLKIFDDNSRKFLQTIEDFANDKITLTTYAKALQVEADNAKVKWNTYHNFSKVVESIKLEDGIDFAKIDRERLDLVDELETKVDKKISDEIVTKSLNYRLGRLSAADYYEFLLKQSKDAKIDMAKYENVINYSKLVKLYAEINDDELFAESERLENAVKAVLFKTDAQINFDKHFKNLEILTKMISLEMTRADLAFYSENKPSAAQAIAFLKNEAKSLNLGIEINEAFGKIDQNLASNEKFYQIAMKRDEVMVEKTLAMMDERGFKTVVLVAGGFHTEGIIKALQAKTVSHMIITPRITNPDAPNYWLQNMTGEETEATKMLKEISATTMASGKTDAPGDRTIRLTAERLKAQSAQELAQAKVDPEKLYVETAGASINSANVNSTGAFTDTQKAAFNSLKNAFGSEITLKTIGSSDLFVEYADADKKDGVSPVVRVTENGQTTLYVTDAMIDLLAANPDIAETLGKNEAAEVSATAGLTDDKAKAEAILKVNAEQSMQHHMLLELVNMLDKVPATERKDVAIEAVKNVMALANTTPLFVNGKITLEDEDGIKKAFSEVSNNAARAFIQAVQNTAVSNNVIADVADNFSKNGIIIREDSTDYQTLTAEDMKEFIAKGEGISAFGINEALLNKGGYVRAVNNVEAAKKLLDAVYPNLASRIVIVDAENVSEINDAVAKNQLVLINKGDLQSSVEAIKSNNVLVKAFVLDKNLFAKGSKNEISKSASEKAYFQVQDEYTVDAAVIGVASHLLVNQVDKAANFIKTSKLFDEKVAAEEVGVIINDYLNKGNLPKASSLLTALFEAMDAAVVFAIAA